MATSPRLYTIYGHRVRCVVDSNNSSGPVAATCPNLGLSGDCDKRVDGEGQAGSTDKHPLRTSIQRCREALGEAGVRLTDAEIEQMRDYLYRLLDIVAEDLEQDLRTGRSGACGAA